MLFLQEMGLLFTRLLRRCYKGAKIKHDPRDLVVGDQGPRWLSGSASDSGATGPGFEPYDPVYTLRFLKYWK